MKILFAAIIVPMLVTFPARADESICRPLAQIAVHAAVGREAGKNQMEVFSAMVKEGRVDPKSSTAEFAANTVVWVFDERISSKDAEKKMLVKCRRAFSKK
jgi:hypothetical protein